jgi:hypothetical protein
MKIANLLPYFKKNIKKPTEEEKLLSSIGMFFYNLGIPCLYHDGDIAKDMKMLCSITKHGARNYQVHPCFWCKCNRCNRA